MAITKEENSDEFVRKINLQMIDDAMQKNNKCKDRMVKAIDKFTDGLDVPNSYPLNLQKWDAKVKFHIKH